MKLKRFGLQSSTTVYILIGIAFVVVTTVNVFSYLTIRGMSQKYGDLTTATRKFETDMYRLKLAVQEMMSNTEQQNATEHVEEYYDTLRRSSVHLAELDNDIDLQKDLADLKKAMDEFYQQRELKNPDPAVEKRFERTFSIILSKVTGVEDNLTQTIDAKSWILYTFFLILLAAITIIFVALFGMVFRYTQHQNKFRKVVLEKQDALQSFVDSLDSILISVDKRGNIVHLNKKATDFFRKSQNSMRGRNLFIVVPELKPYTSLLEVAFHSNSMKERKREKVTFDKGRECTLNMLFTPVGGNTGDPKYMVLRIDDITSEDMMDEQAMLDRKMEVVEHMGANVRKDLNEILSVLSPFLKSSQSNGVSSGTSAALGSAYRKAEALLTKLKTLDSGAQQHKSGERMDAGEVVLETINLFGNILPSDIVLEAFLPDEAVMVNASRNELETIVMNLCANASEALQENDAADGKEKKIIVSMSEYAADKKFKAKYSVGDSQYCLISVQDTAGAIPQDILGRIFEPFFTTKGATHLGLGLTAVSDSVKELYGYIDMASSRSEGTIFKVYIPISHQ